MSFNNKKTKGLESIVKSSTKLTFICIITTLCLCLACSFLLLFMGEPEAYYSVLAYVLFPISVFVTVRFFSRWFEVDFYVSLLFSFFLFCVLIILTLLFDTMGISFKDLIIKFVVIVITSLLGCVLSVNSRKHKKRKNIVK